MRRLVVCAASAFLALSIPIASASAAIVADTPDGSNLVQADWNRGPDWNHGGWHHHWRQEYHDRWYPDWHHHWHHRWDRPYGYQY
jgi:hypothetical protein